MKQEFEGHTPGFPDNVKHSGMPYDCMACFHARHSTVDIPAVHYAEITINLRAEHAALARENAKLREALAGLADCAALVIERWSSGDLADAVRSLDVDLDNARAALAGGGK